MKLAAQVALLASGGFLLTGLMTGVWKYRHMIASDDGTAPNYVNIAHRAALLYSFASVVLFELVIRSPFSAGVELFTVAAPVAFFTVATSSYILNGVTRVTDNQFRDTPNPGLLRAGMWALIIAEVGGISVLFTGFLSTSVSGMGLAVFVVATTCGILFVLAGMVRQGVVSPILRPR